MTVCVVITIYRGELLTRHSILLGSAPEDFRQTKIEDMFDFLEAKDPDNRSGIVTFPNGISETMLKAVLDNSLQQKPDNIFLYICTQSPVRDSEKSLWLCGEEIRRDVITHYAALAEKTGVQMQVVLDWCQDLASDEELGYEKMPSASICTGECV